MCEHVFAMELRHANPRHQGSIGEAIAASWLMQAGYGVWVPFGHSPDFDLIGERDGQLSRIQVKTSTQFVKGRWSVAICTRGGNQSWNKVIKRLDQTRYDYLFIVVADWRCWFIPSSEMDARSGVLLGGPKYARFEINPPRPFATAAAEPLHRA
jgi:hypothetical protein